MLIDYRSKTFPYSNNSWTVYGDRTAVKALDKTLSQDKWTCVPLDVVSFFISKELPRSEVTTVNLTISGEIYAAKLKRRKDGRYNLFFNNSVLPLAQMNITSDTLWFEKDTEDESTIYVYTKSSVSACDPFSAQRVKPKETTRTATTQVRVGQDYFKLEVSKACKGQCVVTRVKDQVPSILIGSHIIPWAECSEFQKLDGNNGLLLAPHIDKLFDKHLITFDENGKIRVANRLQEGVLQAWGIDKNEQYLLSDEQQEYLAFHREKLEELDEKETLK
ncbi:HNH endonuclease [Vibrio splendidus]